MTELTPSMLSMIEMSNKIYTEMVETKKMDSITEQFERMNRKRTYEETLDEITVSLGKLQKKHIHPFRRRRRIR